MDRPNAQLDRFSAGRLIWIEEAGVGYYDCENPVYDVAYFARYAAQADTGIGPALNEFRATLARKVCAGLLSDPGGLIIDVGIGDGAFLSRVTTQPADAREERIYPAEAKGYDINPAGVAWLEQRGMFADLYARTFPVATFWDSLEHIREPAAALDQVERVAIVSIPIFAGVDHILASRHYRKDEHYWYFTRAGFVAFASSCGFEVEDILATESALGRDGIETFVLRRRPDGVG